MEMIKRRRAELKKNGKKGFTLVELIVVIVILAILAAIAVPSLTGYIEKARNEGIKSDAATAYVALQAIGTDVVAHGGSGATLTGSTWTGATLLTTPPFDKYSKIGTETTLGGAARALMGAATNPADANLTDIKYSATGTLTDFKLSNGTSSITWNVTTGYGAVTTP